MNGKNYTIYTHSWLPGCLITLVVVTLVGWRVIGINAAHPAHRKEITAAFGWNSLFYGVPQINNAGNQFIYTSTSPKGYGLYLYDFRTKQKRLIHEENPKGMWRSIYAFYAWPWSPDDSTFVYSDIEKLIICPADTNKEIAQLEIASHSVSDLVWVNSSEFAYISWNTNLCCARKQADGHWRSQILLQGTKMSSLMVVEETTIGWLQDDLICRLDIKDALMASNHSVGLETNEIGVRPPTNGCVLWLDASILSQADQTAVSSLADLSSKRNSAVPNGLAPLYNGPESPRALNGKGTIHFASDETNSNALGLITRRNLGISGDTLRTVFAVICHDTGGVMRINIGDYGAKFGSFSLEEEDKLLYLPRIWNRYSNRVIARTRGWNLYSVVYDGATQFGYVNGLLKCTNNVKVNTVDSRVEIGFRSAGADGKNAAGANGDFAELLVYDRKLGNEERLEVERYLRAKWLGSSRISTKNPLVWCDPHLPGLTSCSYSKESKKFLLNQTQMGRNILWQYDPAEAKAVQLAEASAIKSSQWIRKNNIAYGTSGSGDSKLVLFDSLGPKQTTLLHCGDLSSLQVSPEGNKLFFLGICSNEPAAGIWQYDLDAQQSRCLVSYSEYPSGYAKRVIPFESTIKLPSGRSVNCVIFPPTNFDRKKKYPLVIGNTPIFTVTQGGFGRMGLAAIASCGAYVVVVNRPSWDNDVEQWEENVTGVCKSMEQNPNMDMQKIYLFAASKEVHYLNKCLTKLARPWRGAILLNPGELPEFSHSQWNLHRPKVLISAGEEERRDDRFKKYQEDALRAGCLVDVVISPGEGHFFVGNAAQYERAKAMTDFIFED